MKHKSRREFLKNTSLALAGTALLPATSYEKRLNVRHLGVQLWSVREDMGKDPAASVKALAGYGYREVEGFGYTEGKMFGMPLKDYVKLLKDNGITMPTTHHMVTSKDLNGSDISDAAKKAIDDFAANGARYVICPYMLDDDRLRVPDMVKLYEATGAYAKKAGLRFAYHNHSFEYEKRGPDGRLLIEWLLHEVDPKLMAMQMDIYWVAFANHNPLDWFRLYPGRWELCHAKDLAATEKRESIEVGDGVIDFSSIFKQSQLAGLQHYVIELEHYKTTPLQGVGRARANFLKIR
jgi:sugar phosphate isomerase/epimerase